MFYVVLCPTQCAIIIIFEYETVEHYILCALICFAVVCSGFLRDFHQQHYTYKYATVHNIVLNVILNEI